MEAIILTTMSQWIFERVLKFPAAFIHHYYSLAAIVLDFVKISSYSSYEIAD